MRPRPSSAKKPAEHEVKNICRATRRHFSAEDKIRIVLERFAHQEVAETPEINTLRLTARGLLPKAKAAIATAGDAAGLKGGRSVEGMQLPVYACEPLGGDALVGRMVIEEAYTTS